MTSSNCSMRPLTVLAHHGPLLTVPLPLDNHGPSISSHVTLTAGLFQVLSPLDNRGLLQLWYSYGTLYSLCFPYYISQVWFCGVSSDALLCRSSHNICESSFVYSQNPTLYLDIYAHLTLLSHHNSMYNFPLKYCIGEVECTIKPFPYV